MNKTNSKYSNTATTTPTDEYTKGKVNLGGLVNRYAGKIVDTMTRPLSRKVQLYNDPTYKAPTPKPKRNLVDRLTDRVLLGAQTLRSKN